MMSDLYFLSGLADKWVGRRCCDAYWEMTVVWTQVVTVEMLRREWIRFRRRLGDKRDRSCWCITCGLMREAFQTWPWVSSSRSQTDGTLHWQRNSGRLLDLRLGMLGWKCFWNPCDETSGRWLSVWLCSSEEASGPGKHCKSLWIGGIRSSCLKREEKVAWSGAFRNLTVQGLRQKRMRLQTLRMCS